MNVLHYIEVIKERYKQQMTQLEAAYLSEKGRAVPPTNMSTLLADTLTGHRLHWMRHVDLENNDASLWRDPCKTEKLFEAMQQVLIHSRRSEVATQDTKLDPNSEIEPLKEEVETLKSVPLSPKDSPKQRKHRPSWVKRAGGRLMSSFGSLATRSTTSLNEQKDESQPQRRNGPSIAQRRLQQDLEEQEAKLTEHLNYRFHANPIPATSLLPLYDQLRTSQEERRNKLLSERRLYWQMQDVKAPFTEHGQKERSRRHSAPPCTPRDPMEDMQPFKAKPVPKHLLRALPHGESGTSVQSHRSSSSNIATSAEHREQLRRKRRIQQRAAELLRQSQLPSRMALDPKASGSYLRKLHADRESRAGLTENHTFKPDIHGEVPDFKTLQSSFEASLAARKQKHQLVNTQPFHLRCDVRRTIATKEAIIEEMKREQEQGTEQRWPYMSPRGRVERTAPPAWLHDQVPPPRDTLTSLLKRRQFQKSLSVDQEQSENEEMRTQLKHRLRHHLQNEAATEKTPTTTSPHYNHLQRQSDAVYWETLRQMQQRIANGPLLVERERAAAAARRMERRIDETLTEAGVSHTNQTTTK